MSDFRHIIEDDEIREAVAAIDALDGQDDPERDHGTLDNILMSLVPADVNEAARRLMGRARWW